MYNDFSWVSLLQKSRRTGWVILIWLVTAVAALGHGAWLGTGTIDVSDASRNEIRARIQSGQPALSPGDIVEVYSSFPAIVAGTQDGPGGYATMYVPAGAEVVGAYITDASGNPIPARPGLASTGSGVAKGWGPKGQQAFDDSLFGWQPEDDTLCSVAGYTTADCNNGLAYIYGDTGIFYSTRDDTALFANGSDRATLENGYLVDPTNGTPWTTVGGTGTARVHNKWDAVQVNAFGSGGSIFDNGFSTAEQTSITGGRGATPFRSGSPVAGPDSGSDWDRYGTTGPWQRIQYDGSCRADDPAIPGGEGPANGDGSVYPETTDPGVNSVAVCSDASTTGFDLNTSDLTALPAGTNAVRFAFGGIAENEVYYGALRLRITDPDALGPINAEGHGGDSAQGGAAGNDNPWRYWVAGSSSYAVPGSEDIVVGISIVEVNGAPYGGGDIPPSATVRYRVAYANTSLSPLTDAALQATLPAQTTSTANFEVISGDDIRPASNPSGGTFSFANIPVLNGLGSGAVEFDVTTNAPGGATVQADTRIVANESGPVTDSVSVNVTAAPVEALPGCTGTRFSLVDWATDAPALVGQNVAISRYGITGSVVASDLSQPFRPAAIATANTLYAGTGGNPMLDAQYVDLRVTLSQPTNGVYFYLADLNADESVTVYGELVGQRVSPAMTNGPGSFPMARVANDDGSVTGERTTTLASGAGQALLVGFSQPIDTLIIRHTPLVFSAAGLSGADGMHLADIQACADFTDAPSGLGDALHNFIDGDAYRIGASITGDGGPGNATNADSDDDDGVSIPPMTQGILTTITADVTGTGGLLQAWVDWNGNGTLEAGTAEQIATDLADDGTGADVAAGDGQIQFDVVVPGDAVLDQTYARFRWSSQPALGVTTPAGNGEVEDYAVVVAAAPVVDRGDAPESYGDPQHVIAEAGVAGTYLGSVPPDPDATTQYSANATGDDLDGSDDEDGVILPQLFQGGTTEISVVVNEVTGGVSGVTGAVAYLQAWIDFDGDGSFDAGDMIAADLQDGSAGDKDGVLNGIIVFDVDTPANATLFPTFARFRWSTTAGVVQLAIDGEVEDYQLTISGDAPPVTCDAGLYQIATTNSTLKRLAFTAGLTGYTLNLQDIGSAGQNLNGGWGYSVVDGYLYAVRSGKRELWRVDGGGTFTRMPDPPGSIKKGTNAGDILENGVMVYKADNNTFQLLDISNADAAVDNGLLELDTNVNTVDFAYNAIDGNLYGIDGSTDRIFRVSANGGNASVGTEAVTLFGPATYTGTYGAVWFDDTGRFYIYDNNTNEIFLVDTTTGLRQLIAVSQDDEGGTNDGASCRGPSAIPYGSMSGNVYIDQDGSDAKDGAEINLGGGIAINVYDDRGTPNDITDDIFLKTVDTLADGTFNVGDLSPGTTYRVEVDVTDSDLPAGSQIGTSNPIVGVTVTPYGNTPDINFGFDPQESDLSLTKVAYANGGNTVITQAAPGDLIDFVISINNAGPGSPSGVTVIENLPSGFQYVSDDAPATGDYYDPANGVWFVDEILPGAIEELRITARVLATGNHVNSVEIIASSLDDRDSDPAVGAAVDDLNDGLADDDEDSYAISLYAGERRLSGRIFLDNGSGGGTAHDGLVNGGEVGAPEVRLLITDSTGGVIAAPLVDDDGSWNYALDAAHSGPITLSVTDNPDYMPVSETKRGLPTLVDPDPRDGSFTFTPATETDYAGLDFGLIAAPRLTEDQTAAIAAGQVALLSHEYAATTTGTVLFSYSQVSMTPENAFSAAIYADTDCDGEPEAPLNAAVAVQAGDRLCVISRVMASGGVTQGARLTYRLDAATALDATPLTHVASNTDRVETGSGLGQLKLTKTVRNETQGTAEGTANAGAAGDVLEYRIRLENQSNAAALDVVIFDRTPAYTSLAEPVPSPVAVGGALSCAVVVPASNIAGYSGPLRWDCAGSYPPASDGSVSFKVRIDP
ncbi:DUF11 domain-containing protein [Marinovum algicola]|uniref:DUF11 domain-containing protein n=1 Tax=Marinovum algicola TaxID=42444 RepID=UPI0024B8AD8E|nr:DUF11 domain-containing protein [Marinovum algicola]